MGAQLPRLNTSCCGCTLRLGSLVILWIYLIWGVLWLCSPNISGEYKTNSTVSIVGNTTTTIYQPSSVHGKLGSFGVAGYYPDFGWFAVILGSVDILVAGLGLYGTYEDRQKYLKPFLIWILLDVLVVVIGSVLYMISHHFLVFPFFYVVISIYFWLVILSYYRVLKETSTRTLV